MTRPLIFIGYSHKNRKEKRKLLTHLQVLQREGKFDVWTDDQIKVGSNWVEAIEDAILKAKLAILLISADFLTSEFALEKEVPTLLQLHKDQKLTILPVIARQCPWRYVSWLQDIPVRPENGRPVWCSFNRQVDEDLTDIVKDVVDIIENGYSQNRSRRTRELNIGRWLIISIAAKVAKSVNSTVENLAVLMGVTPQEIQVQRVSKGSMILDLNVPVNAIEHLRLHLQSDSSKLHSLEIKEVILETESGKTEEWIVRTGEFYHLVSSQGNNIIYLLNRGLDKDLSLVDYVQDLYIAAENEMLSDPEKAIGLCKKALMGLEKELSLDASRYSRGKFHILLASIYLNEEKDLRLAEEHYLESKDEFGSRLWFQLEALAYLGLAITQGKLKNLDEARNALNNAVSSVNQEAMPESVDKTALEALRWAIDDEFSRISELFSEIHTEPKPSQREKRLPFFEILDTDRLFAARMTSPNLIFFGDYRPQKSQIVIVDLGKRPSAQEADYILSINEKFDQVSYGVEKGDWLFIQTKNTLKDLNNKTVAVLSRKHSDKGVEIDLSLNTFSQVEDHYFLEGHGNNANSIVITHYNSDISKINDYYANDKAIEIKRAYDIAIVGGVVIDHIPYSNINDITKAFLWQLPIISDIAAGIGTIAEKDVDDYLDLKEGLYQHADFAVRVVGNSMIGDDIFPGDLALIHQQPMVRNGEIAAVVIFTPDIETEPLGVLKRYYIVHEKRNDLRHILLTSSNPASEHLVVIPSESNEEAIVNLYLKKIEAGKIRTSPRFFQDAEIAIAGKYVGKLQEEDNSNDEFMSD